MSTETPAAPAVAAAFHKKRPRATSVLPVLQALAGELVGHVGDAQMRALFHAAGQRLAETYPLERVERLGDLERLAGDWLAANDWGWLQLRHHDDAVDFLHGDAPLANWFGEAGLGWSAALFEGLYATWVRQLGADPRLQLRQVLVDGQDAGTLCFRLTHESRFQ